MSTQELRIGLDFDGVIAYNPFRVVRAPIKWFKRKFLGVRGLTFFVPKNTWQRWMWTMVHESSVLPAPGIELVKQLAKQPEIKLFLITARYGFLRNNLFAWLKVHGIYEAFEEIVVNMDSLQPHLYKTEQVQRLKLDYFVEDNLDIVTYMAPRVKTKVFWIYNILDRARHYEPKYPYLGKALEAIARDRG